MLLNDLAQAGRALSDAAVLFHTVIAAQLGLGPSDWKLMGLLEQDGPLTAGDLAARSGLAPATVTGIVDRLARAGWVQRVRDPRDGRRVVVTLEQEAAARLAGALFQGLERRLADLYARYSDEQLALILECLREIAARQHEATTELTEQARRGAPQA
jgi:DNA-binding MarR family transcriptional regulator